MFDRPLKAESFKDYVLNISYPFTIGESGGQYTNIGHVQIIADQEGKRKTAIWLGKNFQDCQVRFIPEIGDFIIEISHRNGSDIYNYEISQIGVNEEYQKNTGLDTMKCLIKDCIYEFKCDDKEFEEKANSDEVLKKLVPAINAGKRKCEDYHCTRGYWYASNYVYEHKMKMYEINKRKKH